MRPRTQARPILRATQYVVGAGLLCMSAHGSAHAQWFFNPPSDTVPVITASGSGEVRVAPSRAIVYAAVAGRDTSQAAATASAISARDRVSTALTQLGIRRDAVTLWGVGLGADMPVGPMRMPPQGGEPAGSAARFGIRVVVDPISRLDAVLAALARAGVESLPYVRLEAGDETAAVREATQRAVSQARVQAESMARAAGVRLGELRSLSTLPAFNEAMAETRFFYPGFQERGATLAPSDVTVRVVVQGTWQIRRE